MNRRQALVALSAVAASVAKVVPHDVDVTVCDLTDALSEPEAILVLPSFAPGLSFAEKKAWLRVARRKLVQRRPSAFGPRAR